MRHHKEHHPMVGIGLFLIVLGLTLLVATNDLLHLGSVGAYFTWQTAMIFIGLLLFVNLNFVGGVLLMAGGFWFLLDDLSFVIPPIVKTIYWPGVAIILGLAFIVSSFFSRNHRNTF